MNTDAVTFHSQTKYKLHYDAFETTVTLKSNLWQKAAGMFEGESAAPGGVFRLTGPRVSSDLLACQHTSPLLKHCRVILTLRLKTGNPIFLWQRFYLGCCSVAVTSNSLQSHGLQHARLPCPSPSPRVCPSSHPLNQWCHPTIPSSAALSSSCSPPFQAVSSARESCPFHCCAQPWSRACCSSPTLPAYPPCLASP